LSEKFYGLLVLEKAEEMTPLRPLAQPLVHNFDDIFLSNLPPGFPLIIGIEHQIEQLPKASLLNKLAYRCNPIESKEL